MTNSKRPAVQIKIDPVSVATARRELRDMVRGNQIAEAAVAGYSDWEAVQALERMWSVALGGEPELPGRLRDAAAPPSLAHQRRAG